MALSSALFTGLTGLNAHSAKLDVIGNNVANVNTTAFKSSRMLFESLFAQNLGFGTSPSEIRGGVNPKQIGNGVGIAGVQRDFSAASFNGTGDLRDLAIDGSGFFLVQRGGANFYTRAGSFRQDSDDNLATVTGEKLLGYAVDDEFNILTGQLVPINIPVGKQTIAESTSNIALVGNLDKGGDIPTQGSIINLLGDATNGFSTTSGGFIGSATLLTNVEDPDLPGSGTSAFSVGQTIRMRGTNGASRGGTDLPDADFTITATTTVQDFMDFLAANIGIQSTGGTNPDGNTPGVTVDNTTGIITIVGNTGDVNDLVIANGDIELLDTDGTTSLGAPFVTDKTAAADGESVRTTIVGYDSLGAEVTANVTMVLDSTPDTGPIWRYFIDSEDDAGNGIALTTGTLQFDNNGQPDPDNSEISITIDRSNTGADPLLSWTLQLQSDKGNTTSLAASPSSIIGLTIDGLPPGTLESFAAGEDGVIFGRFSNGAVKTMGQVVLANFTNPAGLVDEGGNLFSTGPNSGPASIAPPGTLGIGTIVSGALEQSNVDLGEEFTNMILTSTGYSASSRVIRTADELLQQLLVLGR
ncbi:MAG: flagellar hook-basal body complex protein [Phycisphaerales bacterium]|nr:flagellar hook-basal body complex protein [Phycisphaerales bacterium]